jgi:hypothetical protein
LPDALEFVLLDSDVTLEFVLMNFCHFYDSLAPGAVAVFHDTSVQHAGLAKAGSGYAGLKRLSRLRSAQKRQKHCGVITFSK